MAEGEKSSAWSRVRSSVSGTMDNIFTQFADYVTAQISTLVAILFIIFSAGSVYGAYFVAGPKGVDIVKLVLPPIFGLLSLYHRDIAILFFLIFLGGIVILV